MTMKKMLVVELVLDHEIYPRQEVNSVNITDIAEAMKAGVKMPPPVVDQKSLRVVDGWHRVKAALRLGGDAAELVVELREYASDAAIFEDCMRLNAVHGHKLSHFDMTRSILRAEHLKLEPERIASALGLTVERLADMKMRVVQTNGKEMVPIKRTVAHLYGQRVTRKQEEAADRTHGMPQLFYVNQVINLLEGDIVDLENKRLLERLVHLGRLINARAAVKA